MFYSLSPVLVWNIKTINIMMDIAWICIYSMDFICALDKISRILKNSKGLFFCQMVSKNI